MDLETESGFLDEALAPSVPKTAPEAASHPVRRCSGGRSSDATRHEPTHPSRPVRARRQTPAGSVPVDEFGLPEIQMT